MKKIIKSLFLISLVVVGVSCEDASLDPLQFDKFSGASTKGTMLALRGDALAKLYVEGKPISEIFPRILTGTEKFTYEAEILATDPGTLASVDVFAIKKLSATTTERKLLQTVDASAFAKGDYPNPSATIEIGISSVLTALGLTATYPLSLADVNVLLNTYKFGVNIESDINLTNGGKVLAADIVNSGLFGSNQFYPAMRLNWAVTDFCTYTTTWSGTYTSNEVYSDGVYGPYNVTFSAKPGGTAHQLQTTNFWDSGITAYIEFTPSTGPDDQNVLFPTQDDGGGKSITSTSGKYDECLKVIKIQTLYLGYDWRYEFTKQ